MPSPLVLSRTGVTIADDVVVAATVGQRLRGLLGYRAPLQRTAFLLPRAKQVHTFGMAFPIDVVFCGRTGNVLHVVRSLRPCRVTRWIGGARWTFELSAGAAAPVEVDDVLEWEGL